ncbi:hypothetical protein BgiMline_023872 [Biomphalaria glabrata]|nr:hypothetical protein BgiMline_007099 [Biomphalaria glabrata]
MEFLFLVFSSSDDEAARRGRAAQVPLPFQTLWLTRRQTGDLRCSPFATVIEDKHVLLNLPAHLEFRGALTQTLTLTYNTQVEKKNNTKEWPGALGCHPLFPAQHLVSVASNRGLGKVTRAGEPWVNSGTSCSNGPTTVLIIAPITRRQWPQLDCTDAVNRRSEIPQFYPGSARNQRVQAEELLDRKQPKSARL